MDELIVRHNNMLEKDVVRVKTGFEWLVFLDELHRASGGRKLVLHIYTLVSWQLQRTISTHHLINLIELPNFSQLAQGRAYQVR
jgi:hypothetical protein